MNPMRPSDSSHTSIHAHLTKNKRNRNARLRSRLVSYKRLGIFLATLVICATVTSIFFYNRARAATTYTWNQTGTASWALATNWTPTRTTPAVDDVLIFNNAATTTVTNVPTQTIGQLLVSGNTTVSLQPAAGVLTLTIGGVGGPDLSVDVGSALNISGGAAATNTLKILMAAGTTGLVNGSMTFSTAQHQLDSTDASGITFNLGSTFTYNPGGLAGNAFTNAGTSNAVLFLSGSTYVSQSGANPFGLAQPASKVVFQAGSLFRQTSTGTPAFSGRSYANFELNNAAANITVTGGSAVLINDLTITAGTLNFNMTATPGHAIKGNISVASGATLNFNPASAGTINLSGSSAQSISSAGTLTFAALQSIVVSNTNGVTVNSAVTLPGSTTVNAGATLAVGATLTNSGTMNVNGSFQINQGGFASGNNFVYSPTGTLIFANTSGSFGVSGTPAYWPVPNGPQNVNVQGGGGITMSVPRTVLTSFQYAAGVSGAGNLTLNTLSQVNTGGFTSGSPTYGAGTLLRYNIGGSYGRNGEWLPGVISGPGYPHHVQLSNNTTLDLPNSSSGSTFQMAGDLTIDAGSTMQLSGGTPLTQTLTIFGSLTNFGILNLSNAGGGDLNVGGSWNNSGTFNNNGRTVNLNGSIGQTITGNSNFFNLTKASSTTQTLTFAAGSTQTVTNALTLTAVSPQTLSLRSTVSGTQWKLNVLGTHSVSFVDVKDSDASGGSAITPTSSVNSGNNINWVFAAADYTVTTTGNAIVVTDVSGNGDVLTVSEPAAGQIKFAAPGRGFSVDGGPTITGDSGNLSLSGINSVTVNQAAGADTLNTGGFTTPFPQLTINGGTGDDTVNFTGNIAFLANANLDVDLQNDDVAPGIDAVSFGINANVLLSGTGAARVKASRNIVLNSGSVLQVVNGNLLLDANQQLTETSGDFNGVNIDGGLVQSTGDGNVILNGRGGSGDFIENIGVRVANGGKVKTTGNGTIDVQGTGGTGSGSATAGQGNLGVYVTGAGSAIISSVSALTVNGVAGTTNDSNVIGIIVDELGTIETDGPGTLTINGTGGTVLGGGSTTFVNSGGVFIAVGDVNGDAGLVKSTGTGANAGAIVITGVGTPGDNGASQGVRVDNPGAVTTVDGPITVTGSSAACGNACLGTSIRGNVTATGTGAITLTGTGAATTGVFPTHGVNVRSTGLVSTTSGNITITGAGGNGTDNAGFNLASSGPGTLQTTGGGAILINADTIRLATGATATINAGSNVVSLRQKTNGVAINLGSPVDSTANTLELSDLELDRITAGTLNFGNASSGAITVSASITRASATILNLISGDAINLNASSLNSGGGNVSLTPGASSSVAPTATATDVSMAATGTLTFVSGADLAIVINGTTVDTQYRQLNVIGQVNLTGVDLVLSGTHLPVGGQSFIIVNNDGADAITGTFNGLPQGAVIPNFLGSGLGARISYTGGDGNDVVISVLPTISIAGVSVSESGGTATFVVTQSAITGTTTTFTYSTSNFTAIAGSDYTGATNAPASIPAGLTSTNINIPILSDGTFEGNERFNVTISNAVNATISNATATGTIVDDDTAPIYLVNANDDNAPVSCTVAHCNLREAINAANAAPGQINFAPSVTGQINLLSQLPFISSNYVNINGPGSGVLTVRRDNSVGGTFGIFRASSSGAVIISGLTISNANNFHGITYSGIGSLDINNCVISGNATGSLGGGALFTTGGTVNITNSTVSGNTAVGGEGGAIRLDGPTTLNINGSTFSGNSASNLGCIHNNSTGTVTINNSLITGNSAISDAGGINNGNNGPGTLIVINSRITNNTAGNVGGGIKNGGTGTVTVIDSTIDGNTASSSGGGIINVTTGIVNVTRSTISNNTASFTGGGIFNDRGTVNITNSTISTNHANGGVGGGFRFSNTNGQGTGNITASTITGNTAVTGGGLAQQNVGTVTIRNTIVAGNSSDILGTITSGGYNLIGNNSGGTFIGNTGDLIGTSGTPINPLLGPLQNNGGPTVTHSLLSGSPAIDAGNAFSLTTDQRGFARPFDSPPANVSDGSDIGAFEVQATPATITATAGTPQSAVVNTAFATQFQATVKDASNNPVGAVSVTFTAPASGPSGTFPGSVLSATAVTDSNGVATAPVFTANGTLGSYNVSANTTPALGSPALFALSNVALASFSIDDVTHSEGNTGTTIYTFTVTRTGGTSLAASVNFTTQDGTATLADNDYQLNSGTLNFAPSVATMPITVLVNGDFFIEPEEAFNVHLDNPTSATISDADGTGTIQNDDVTPNVVYVNTTFTGPIGSDPDGAGPANAIGYDAFANIQAGVNAVASGGTVHVAAGTYPENVLVNKSVSLLGPNSAINPNTGTRGAEAIVVPAVTETSVQGSTSGTIFRVGSGSGHVEVTINGFTIDGHNASLTAGRTLNGVEVHTGAGIINSIGSFDTNPGGYNATIIVQNNIIQNLERYGVLADGVPATTPLAGTNVSFNKIDNIPSGNNFGGGRGRGVAFEENHYGSLTNNVMTRVNVGWQDDNYYLASPSAGTLVDNNEIHTYHRGIFHNLQYQNATNATITNNNIFAETSGDFSASSTNFGIELASIFSAVGATVTGNNSTGNVYGILLWNLSTTANVTVTGGTLTGNNYGVFATSNDPQFSAASASQSSISGVTITNATVAGIAISDSPAAAATTLNITGGTSATGGPVGLLVDGPGATVGGNTLGDTSFSGQPVYVQLANGALDNQEINATGVSFAGQTGPTNMLAQNFALVDKLVDAVDVGSVGLVRVKTGNVFVTPNSFSSPATTTPDAQRGVDAAIAGDAIITATGTYTGAVNVNKAATLNGSFTNGGTLSASAAGATLSPGYSPGIINSGDLSLTAGSFVNIELAGTTPGTGHDQLNVTGTVSLGSATLNTTLSFTSAINDNFVIVSNDGADPVSGTFNGLAQGATFIISGERFRIFYNGGTGNDVVLIHIPATVPIVYVDDDWAGTAFGADPDGGGPATSFGVDAFATIQDGVNGVDTSGQVIVRAGNYFENPTITRAMTLKGAQFGVDARGRVASESIVRSNGNQNAVFSVTGAANVTIDGFSIDGDDPAVTGAPLASGDDTNTQYGIRPTGVVSNLIVSNNIIRKVFIGLRGDVAAQGNVVTRNSFDSIGNFDFGYCVSIRNNFYADITDNKMTRAWTGVHINNHNGPGGPANFLITGNEIHSYAGGILYWLQFNGATGATVNNNQMTAETGAVANNFGVLLVSIQNAVNPTFTNNAMTGHNYGVGLFNVPTTTTITLGATNSISGSSLAGVFLTDNLNFNPVGATNFLAGGPGAASTVNVNGVSITGNTGDGIKVEGQTNLQTVSASGDTITGAGGTKGLEVIGGFGTANLTSSTITGFSTGIALSGSSTQVVTAHFNRIVATTAIDNPNNQTPNLENNWLGCNDGPGNAGCGAVTGTGADFNPWIVLLGSATPNSIGPGGTATVVADMTHNSDNAVPVGTLPNIPDSYSATNGTMSPTTGTIIAGAASSTFTSTNSSNAVATITVDNQNTNVPITVNAPAFSIDDVTHLEGNPPGTTAYTFTITKTGTTAFNSSVDYETVDGSATAPSDYTAIPVTNVVFLPAETTKQVTILVNRDYSIEPDEAFTVHLSNPLDATISDADGTGTIQNDDVVPNTVYVDPAYTGPDGSDPDGGGPAIAIGYDAFDKIQEGVDAVAVAGTVIVHAGTYDEDVLINKAGLQVLGAAAGTTNIRGPIGGPGSTIAVAASNVTIAGFTITRLGNNTTDWNNPNLNTVGIAIQGQAITATLIRDNILTGNRTGIDINNSNGHTVRNNVIDFNRTGMIFRNQTDQMTVVENFITNNWTVGIVFLDGSGGTNVPQQTALYSVFSNNNLSANWYGQIVDRQSGGSLPAPGTTNTKNFRGDWFGTTSPVVTTANSAEPGYAAQIPVAYGGTATPPGGQPDVAGPASANFKIDPWLLSGTDTNVETTPGRGTNGFQGVQPLVVVTPASLHGWVFFDDMPGTGTGSGGFEDGPGTPPLGVGSAFLSVDAQGRLALGTGGYGGARMDSISELRYSSYQDNNSNTVVAASLQFDIDYDLNDTTTSFMGRLVFEPYLSGTVQQNVWQNWDAYAGNWYGSRTTVTVGNVVVPQPCQPATPCTWSQVLALFPNAGVRNTPTSAVLFKAGGPWAPGFEGNVDNFAITIGTRTTFDFEPLPHISINDVTQSEGNAGTTSYTFTVTLSRAFDQTITVNYATADSTALAPVDYTAVPMTPLTFNPGETSKPVTVQVNGDTTFENNEQFFVNLSNAINATILDGQGVGTITNDDTVPTFTIDDVTHNEGDAGTTSYVFTITKTGGTELNSSVDYATVNGSATAPSDFTAIPTTNVVFLPAETTKQVTVLVNGDTGFEPNETFTVHLSNAVGATIADADGTGTITNDDPCPTTFTVNDNGDAGDVTPGDGICATVGATCTLRAAIEEANALASCGMLDINFALGSTTITLGSELTVSHDVRVNGPSASALIISGNNTNRIFTVNPGVTASVSNLTLSGGNGSGGGGAIQNSGALTLSSVTLSGNTTTSDGGAIRNDGVVSLVNSTVSGNSASGNGGGIASSIAGTVTLVNSTITANTGTSGGGIKSAGTLNIRNSIVAQNNPDNVSGTVTDQGNNLLSGDPLLGTLRNNGGPTFTHALLYNSPAVDAGNGCVVNNSCTPAYGVSLLIDQRGLARQVDGDLTAGAIVDIGAYERQAPETRVVPAGANVLVDVADARLTFPSVTGSGNSVNLSAIPVPGDAPPSSGPAFDISPSSAFFTGPVNFCFYLPSITNPTTFSTLKVLHREGGVLVDPGSRLSFTDKIVCTQVASFSEFVITHGAVPTVSNGTVSGRILDNSGNPVAGATVQLSGTQSRLTVSDSEGKYHLENVETNGFYTVTPSRSNYVFVPAQRSFSQIGENTDAAFTASDSGSGLNPLDATVYFVRQQYLDFLGREPDEAGLNFWVNNIDGCGAARNCRMAKRTDTSAAFFLSIESQQTGYLVYRMYQSAYGEMPGTPVPLRLAEFRPDTQKIGRGVVVNESGWQAKLEANKRAFALEFVQRARFVSAYPTTMTPDEFVDGLFLKAGVSPEFGDRAAAVAEFGGVADSGDVAARARALRQVAENAVLKVQKFNRAFVLMQYFGYLGRDPNSGPDSDYSGYSFWLNKLDNFNGDFRSAEMVKAFLVAGEYRGRFPR